MVEKIELAVIGGSGLYSMSGLTGEQEIEISTPFGDPSSPIVVGRLDGKKVAFLARHGKGHHISPSEVPYRANIYALKALGADRIVSINACGSLRQKLAPGHIVIPDQLYDNTRERPRTFFGNGLVAHVGVAHPFCPDLSKSLLSAVRMTGNPVHYGGTFIIIEGPRFSTKAESELYRSWGMSIIGMTAVPEAFLAREAEMCYAVMAHVTDYDVWHDVEAAVSVDMVIKILNKNTEIAQTSVRNLVKGLSEQRTCSCESALATSLITDRAEIPPATLTKMDLLVKKYLK
jgi:5'-methylthioadenosine phosphorylase